MPARICRIFLVPLLIFLPIFASAQSSLININTATLAELDGLPHVGATIAQRIINGRPYASVEEISKVQGIGNPGSTTYEDIINLITVGNSSTLGSEENGSSETTAGETSGDSGGGGGSPQNQSTVVITTYYSASPLSSLKPETALKISAGQDRLGSVGSPLEFLADTDLNYTKNSVFKWNFGDGSEGGGEVLNHVYKYPGDYVVVLNVGVPGSSAIARVNVKIIEPEIIISAATRERITVKNNSKYEISLFGRALVEGEKFFAFPQDTIVKAGQSISFSSKITGLEPNGVNDVGILVVGSTEQNKLADKIKEQKSERIAYLQSQISLLQNQMASFSPKLSAQPENEALAARDSSLLENAEAQTAVAKEGWLQVLKRFFLRNK